MEYFYEMHDHIDPILPMTCNYYTKTKSFGLHCHKNIEMLFITEGSGEFTLDNKSFTAKCGDLVIVNPYRFHSMKSSPFSPVKYICLITHSSFYEDYDVEYNSEIFENKVTDETVMNLGYKIFDESQKTDTPYYKEYIKAYINILIIHLLRNHRNFQSKANDVDSRKYHIASSVIEYIRRNFRDGINVDVMADELGYCKFHLCRIFKEVTGTTILQYTNNLKCFYAEQLLSTGKYSVHEVSELCGFESDSYFSALFKKFRGVLPSAVRN